MEAPKKPPRAAGSPRRPRLPLRPVRLQIWAAACDLVIQGHGDEVSAVLANRFHTSERIIDMVLVTEGMRQERVAAAPVHYPGRAVVQFQRQQV